MSAEQDTGAELAVELVRGYADTFISRWDMYPYQRSDGKYYTVKKPLTLELIERHLLGKLPTLGVYALDRDSKAKWVCFDADDAQEWQRLLTLSAELLRSSVPGFLEPSRRGGHLWLFTPEIDGFTARRFAQGLAQEYNLDGVEVFPKQDRLTTGPGSLVRLPLGIHRLTNTRYHFITPAGDPLAPTIREQIAILADPPRVPADFLTRMVEQGPAVRERIPRPTRDLTTTSSPLPPEALLSERIKAAISVRDYVSRYVELDGRGRGHCPFHYPDEHKSFQINEERGFWHCYAGCGGGSIIDFVMKLREQRGEDYSFKATLHVLAEELL